MKYTIILFSIFLLFASCEREEPKVNSKNQNFVVYNEEFFCPSITVDDGFIVLTKKENEKILNKLDFEGNKVWQKNISTAFDFTKKLEVEHTKLLKTKDNGFLIILAYNDVLKYGNSRRYVKYLKLDENRNIIFNFDRIILDDNPGHYNHSDDDYSSYCYNDAYEMENGNIVCFSKRYIYDSAQLQISKYTTSGDLISNEEIDFPWVWDIWNIIYFSDNLIYVNTTIDDDTKEAFVIYKLPNNGKPEQVVSVDIKGIPFHSLIYNDNFIICYEGNLVDDNQLIEFDKQGNIIKKLYIKNRSKQFLIKSAQIVNEDIYFVGLTTKNSSSLYNPKIAWGKLQNEKFKYLGKLESIESSEGFSLNINTDKSISILGQKKSFGKKNMFFLKTKTDGTIDIN